ncbi:DMT family transporter [Sulfuriferula thiophila]|uniref:DMT family transporter n=1 Tax=Sulfuriferula thiophila TaxID=1781211 RepID=UPI000F60B1BE|nr:DMT family transporter [Sulfuriferula thiophila]
MKTNSVYLLVIVATVFWGANFALAGPILHDVAPLWAAALRFTLGALIMITFVSWRGESLIAPARRHAGVYLLIGAIGIGGFNLLFFYALQTTSAGNAALIMATNPLMTTLLAAVTLGERPGGRLLLSLPLALSGVFVVVTGGDMSKLAHLQDVRGDLLMLGANVAWAAYNVLSRSAMPKLPALTNTTLVMSAGAMLLLIVAISSGEQLTMPGVHAAIALAIMVTAGTVLAYLFWNTGIAHLGAGRTALFLNLVPVFAMLTAAIMGTMPTLVQIIGGILVIGGVSLAMLPRSKASTVARD